jgi:hypothetical protein
MAASKFLNIGGGAAGQYTFFFSLEAVRRGYEFRKFVVMGQEI